MPPVPDFTLERTPFGKLRLTLADGSVHDAVLPVRAFPISAPDQGIALVSSDAHELVWIDRLESLSPPLRALIEAELASREFMPVISRIRTVSSFATPSVWTVETDRGITELILKSEDDIRRLPGPALLIADSHGIHYLVRDRNALDVGSRRLLSRFL